MDDVDGLKVGVEGKQHECAVAEGLNYLKSVVSVDSEMHAVRVARQIRQKKLLRLVVNSCWAQEVGAGKFKQDCIIVADL